MDTNTRLSLSIGIPEALISLTPGAEWVLHGDSYEGLEWLDKLLVQPTEEECDDEIARLRAVDAALEYQRKRSAEYPNFLDYIDGVVKNDQEQIDKYIAECMAVKAKYPKPE